MLCQSAERLVQRREASLKADDDALKELNAAHHKGITHEDILVWIDEQLQTAVNNAAESKKASLMLGLFLSLRSPSR